VYRGLTKTAETKGPWGERGLLVGKWGAVVNLGKGPYSQRVKGCEKNSLESYEVRKYEGHRW